jgi:hypothetical protein
MQIPPECFRPFPTYESVFYDDLENHKKHFLPICSINLKFLFPERDEWFHFVSAKEIYEDCVGQYTQAYHTKFTSFDMLGFQVIEGKYKFEADWNYFHLNQKNEIEQQNRIVIENAEKANLSLEKLIPYHKTDKYLSELAEAYRLNTEGYELLKLYFETYGEILAQSIQFNSYLKTKNIADWRESVEERKQKYPNFPPEMPEINGFLEDIKHLSPSTQQYIQKNNISLEEMNNFEGTNLLDNLPYNEDGQIFEYIGCLTGFYFQYNGADALYLFYDEKLKKAVICFEYT